MTKHRVAAILAGVAMVTALVLCVERDFINYQNARLATMHYCEHQAQQSPAQFENEDFNRCMAIDEIGK